MADSAGTPLTSGALSDRLGFTAAAVTYLVDRMIELGHIRLEPHPKDRRKVILRYSEHGVAVAHKVLTALATSMHSFRSDLESPTGG